MIKIFCVFHPLLLEEPFSKRALLLKNGPERQMNASIGSPFCPEL